MAMGSHCMWTLGHHRSSPKVNLTIGLHSKIINLIYGTIVSVGEIFVLVTMLAYSFWVFMC